ncbi:MAG: caspase family protein [Candidatus Bathyarchaeota archaeon]|nr:MAG: caspase family protein [Candidatus Bathyarchaeota archaeon]
MLFSTAPTTSAEPRTTRYTIIIGISDYQTINELDLSDDDALAMRDVLDAISWIYIITITDLQATKTGIRNAITALIGVADTDDLVLFYFAGHGARAEELHYHATLGTTTYSPT